MMSLFNVPLRADPWPAGLNPIQKCPVCGETWQPWAGSRLACHTACLFTDETLLDILASRRTDAQLSTLYGVTVSVVRSVRAPMRQTG